MSAHKSAKPELAKKILGFLEYLEIEKGSSPLTIRNYRHYLGRFRCWMKDNGYVQTIGNIDQEVLRKYRLYLSRLPAGPNRKNENISKKTQGYHIIALRSFLKWLIRRDYEVISPDKIDVPKSESKQIKFLTGTQVDRLLNAPTAGTIIGKRDRAILEVLFSTGLRVSELIKLDRKRIDFKRGEFGIVGKGGKTRLVFISKRAAGWVEKYLLAREDKFKPLFIRHKGKIDPTTADEKMRLSVRSVQRLVKKYVRKIKLSVDATPHVLRHSFATDLLVAGADLRSVQEMLGHKNVSTTQVYTHVTNRQLRDVHSAFHGKGGG